MIDLNEYKGIKQALDEIPEFKDDINEIPMLYMSEDDAALRIAEMVLLINASCSDSLQLRKLAKEKVDHYFINVKGKVNYLPLREGVYRLDMTLEESRSVSEKYQDPLIRRRK